MASAIATLGSLDTLKQTTAEFDQQKDLLLSAMEANGGALQIRANVPNLRVRSSSGGRRSLKGPHMNPDGTFAPGVISELTSEIVESPYFSPGLGLSIIKYLAIEEHNRLVAKGKKKGKIEHKTVLLNDGHTRVRPFDVGSLAYFAELDMADKREKRSPFAPPQFATMAKPDDITEELKQMIATQIAAQRAAGPQGKQVSADE